MEYRAVFRMTTVLAGSLLAAALAAQEGAGGPFTRPEHPGFGTTSLTYLRVSALEFLPSDGSGYSTFSLLRWPTSEPMMLAPLHLPDGAIIDYLEIDFCDSLDPADIHLELRDCGPLGATCDVVANVNSFGNPGCSQISTSGINYTVDNRTSSFALRAFFQSVDDVALQLGGAIVGYRLQVSPPPATASFNDVPTTHPYFQFIEALKASGITGGCQASPPLYCPDSPLTRGQMAVFLAKALGLHW
jgi:hypothetical protein